MVFAVPKATENILTPIAQGIRYFWRPRRNELRDFDPKGWSPSYKIST